jgi:general secretion pathway protein A
MDQRTQQLRDLGFSEEPFSNSADPRFFYASKYLADVQYHLQQMIDQRRALGVVEADYGMGKSSLARRLDQYYRARPESYFTIYIHSSKYITLYSLLNDVSKQLGAKSRRAVMNTIREIELALLDHYKNGRNVILFFDDAQDISVKALHAFRIFYNFDVTAKLVQCLLFGQPEIRENFKKVPEVVSRIDTWMQLSPLDISEMTEMIEFRTKLAGRKDPLFTRNAFEGLWEVTLGVPRATVNVCQAALNMAIEIGDTKISAKTLETACSGLERRRVIPDV